MQKQKTETLHNIYNFHWNFWWGNFSYWRVFRGFLGGCFSIINKTREQTSRYTFKIYNLHTTIMTQLYLPKGKMAVICYSTAVAAGIYQVLLQRTIFHMSGSISGSASSKKSIKHSFSVPCQPMKTTHFTHLAFLLHCF